MYLIRFSTLNEQWVPYALTVRVQKRNNAFEHNMNVNLQVCHLSIPSFVIRETSLSVRPYWPWFNHQLCEHNFDASKLLHIHPGRPCLRAYYCFGDIVHVAIKGTFDLDDHVSFVKGIVTGGGSSFVSIKFSCYCSLNEYTVPRNCIFIANWRALHERCRSTNLMLLLGRLFAKDIRLLIGQYVWKTRDDAEWGYF